MDLRQLPWARRSATEGHPMNLRQLAWVGSLLAGCYDPNAVVGLPCSTDEGCGPDHVCAQGYCYAHPDDALAHCGDDERTPGEACYPLSHRVELPIGEGELREVVWGTLDDDGLEDALTLTDQTVVSHLNLGAAFSSTVIEVELCPASLATLELPEPFASMTLAVHARRLALGKIGSDQRDDVVATLIVTTPVPQQFEPLRALIEEQLWLVDNATGSTVTPHPVPRGAPLGSLVIPRGGLQIGDFDGDGRGDLLVGGAGPDGFEWWWLPDVDQGTTPARAIPLVDSGSPTVADVDGDGRDDVVVPSNERDLVAIARGPLTAEPEGFELASSPRSIHVGSFDDTPGLEIAVLLDGERQLWGAPAGMWTRLTTVEGPDALDIAAADLDGDGRADLLTAEAAGVTMHLGFDGPQFGAPFIVAGEPGVQLQARSLTDDDAPDLVTMGRERVVLRLAAP